MSKPNKVFTKTKIIIGYLLFAAILISATVYTAIEVKSLLNETDTNIEQAEKRICISNTLTHLFNAESHIGPMIIDTNDFYAYKKEAQNVLIDLEQLKKYCSENHISQIDSIKYLMQENR